MFLQINLAFGLYRSVKPHVMLDEMFGGEFDVEINYEVNWSDLPSFLKYDIIHFHKGLYNNMEVFWNALNFFKENKIVTIMDIDDHWEVGPNHPLYMSSKEMKWADKITKNLTLVDYVTTTTEIFAKKIRRYNENVYVFPNAIDPNEEQYKPYKNPSDKIRFGFVMGSSHEKDMEQFKGVVNSLPKDVLDKIQIVLCGYDLRGTINIVQNGKITGSRPIQPKESVWYSYERNVTDEYRICSPEYREFLLKFIPDSEWPNVDNEHYRRAWTKDVNCFR